ncbi:MAG TPA: hypothetical protein VFC58_05120 [Desulfosporosinus sp.]|nr:hypothetical protein [Desulfosporosinus sp.]
MPIFLKLIVSVFLLIGIVNPKIAWMISEGWKFKNAEPSEVYLIVNNSIIKKLINNILFLGIGRVGGMFRRLPSMVVSE